MKPAVAYIRVSKEKSEGVSPDTQLAKIRAYCAAQDWQLIDVFRDLDFSGRAADNRPAFQDMMARIENGGIYAAVVYRVDRFSRSLRDFVSYVEEMRAHGTSLVSVNESFDVSTPIGRAMVGLLAIFAQLESETTGQRVSDNLKHIASGGKWLGGSPPYGYRLNKDGWLVIHDGEAETVRWIFDRYLGGHGTRSISGDLSRRPDKPSPSGNPLWRYGTINWMLRNATYAGGVVWDGEVYAGKHEPIIERATFELAQAAMKANTNREAAARGGTRPLSGLMRCGLCGSMGNVKHGHGDTVRFICSRRSQVDKRACDNVIVDEPSLNRVVLRSIAEHVDSNQIVRKEKALPDARPEDGAERAAIEKRLSQLKKLLDRLFADHYEAEIITRDQFIETNSRYLAEQEQLRDRLEDMGDPHRAEMDAANLEAFRRSAGAIRRAWDAMEPTERSLAVSQVIREVVWSKEGVEIEYEFGSVRRIDYQRVTRGCAYLDEK